MAFFGRSSATSNPLSRRVFYWCLAASFFATTSTVIFYSLGYRYEDVLLHTGSVNFKSQPRDVELFVGGKKPSIRHLNFINNSFHLTGIRHGFYTLEAQSEGYKPWSKEIRIRSGLATEFWNVVLLQESYERSPHSVINPQRLFFAPRGDFLAYPQSDISDTSLYIPILNIEDDEVAETHAIPYASFRSDDKENIEWSPNTRFLATPILRGADVGYTEEPEELLDTPSDPQLLSDVQRALEEDTPKLLTEPLIDYAIVDRERDDSDVDVFQTIYMSQLIKDFVAAALTRSLNPDEQVLPLTQEPARILALDDIAPRMLRWHPKNDDTLLTLIGTNLVSLNILGESERSELLADDVLAYDFSDDGIYILTTNGSLFWGRNFSLESPELLTSIALPEDTETFRLIAYDNSRILMLDDTLGSLTLYNDFKDVSVTTKIVDEGLRAAQFSDDGKKMLYHTDRTASVYFMREWVAQPYRASNSQYTILESDADIEAVEWTNDYEHFIASIDSQLFLAELDNRGEYRVEPFLDRSLTDSNIIMDQRENILYFTEQTDEDTTTLQSITFPYEKPGLF